MKLHLAVYTNGDEVHSAGSFNLAVDIEEIPLTWKRIWVAFNLKCEQTGTEGNFLVVYDSDVERHTWDDDMLYLQEIRDGNYQTLDFSICIQIIRIQLFKRDEIIYNYLTYPWHPTKHQSFMAS